MENKCEKLKIAHAWRDSSEMYGFSIAYISYSEICANCGLKKNRNSQTKEWWSYSDGRPDEPIINIKPV